MAPHIEPTREGDSTGRTTACSSCPNRSECFGRIFCSRKQATADR